MIEAKWLAIGNAERLAGSNRRSAQSRVIGYLSELGTMIAWNEHIVEVQMVVMCSEA